MSVPPSPNPVWPSGQSPAICLSLPHGPKRQAVGQVGVVGQQGGEQVARTGVHRHAFPEQHFSEATEGTPCRGSLSSAPRCGLTSHLLPLPRPLLTPG